MKLTSTADGFEFEAYHARPNDARRGGLVMIQEIFGVTQGMRDLADGFAEDGYEVLVPQMFDRREPGFATPRDPEGIAKGRGYVQAVGYDNAPRRRAGLYRRAEGAGVHHRLLLWRHHRLAGGLPLHGPQRRVRLLRGRHRRLR